MTKTIIWMAAAGLLLGGTGGATFADKDKGDNRNMKMTEEWGYKRPGKTIREFVTNDLEQCKELCLRDSNCKAYVYRTGKGECALKFDKGQKERDNNRVTGIKVPKTGAEDKDDYGQWGKADHACREEVAKKFNVPKQQVRLEYDESFENKVRFQWRTSDKRGMCEATEGGRITDFNTRDGGKGSAGAGAASGGAAAMDKKAKDDESGKNAGKAACQKRAADAGGVGIGQASVNYRKTEGGTHTFSWSAGGSSGTCKTNRDGNITSFETKATKKKQAK